MADVGEIWHRARNDRAFREQLEQDPAALLAGFGLSDDELDLLDAALRPVAVPSIRQLFAVAEEQSPETDGPHPTGCATSPQPTGGTEPAERKEPS